MARVKALYETKSCHVRGPGIKYIEQNILESYWGPQRHHILALVITEVNVWLFFLRKTVSFHVKMRILYYYDQKFTQCEMLEKKFSRVSVHRLL